MKINVHSSEWQIIKKELLERRNKELDKLIKSTDHENSMEIRGALRMIDQLLTAEKDALVASQHNK